jgi:hypothetical protein
MPPNVPNGSSRKSVTLARAGRKHENNNAMMMTARLPTGISSMNDEQAGHQSQEFSSLAAFRSK